MARIYTEFTALQKKKKKKNSLARVFHDSPHRVFFGSLLEAMVATDSNTELIKILENPI